MKIKCFRIFLNLGEKNKNVLHLNFSHKICNNKIGGVKGKFLVCLIKNFKLELLKIFLF